MKEVIVFMKTEAVNEPKLYGYARVSTFQQKEDRQIIALKSIGVLDKNIYVDKQTGKDFNRPQYKKLLRKLDASSVLVIKSLDRLGRNYHELSEQWRIITKEKRSDIVVIDVPLLDTRREKNLLGTLISDLILSLLSYCSDNELRNYPSLEKGISKSCGRCLKSIFHKVESYLGVNGLYGFRKKYIAPSAS